jgi:hypothetical protein
MYLVSVVEGVCQPINLLLRLIHGLALCRQLCPELCSGVSEFLVILHIHNSSIGHYVTGEEMKAGTRWDELASTSPSTTSLRAVLTGQRSMGE